MVRKRGHKPMSATFRTKAAAENWARGVEDKLSTGTFVDTSTAETTLVAGLLQRYEKEITPRKKSAKKEESRIKILSAELGLYSVAALTPEAIVAYVDKRARSVSSDTIRKELNTLSHAIDTGIVLWRIHLAGNPVITARMILSRVGTLKQGTERDRRLSPGELKRLLQASEPSHKALWIWALESAMRRGEIASMRPSHRVDGSLKIPETKTGRPRAIPVTRHMARVWEQLPWGKSGLCMKADSITQAFDRACKKARIEGLRFHDLRHEATSRLFEKGLQIQEVASITGHTDWKSLKRYTHLRPDQIAKKLHASARRDKRQRRADPPPETSPPSESE